MKKTYLEIAISANERQKELLVATMTELGCQGFQETDSHLLCYIDKSLWTEDKSSELRDELKGILQTISVNACIEFRDIEEENWNEQWEKTINFVEVGKKLVIKPSWGKYENRENRIVVQIDPKMSFGTGYHETTRLTLRLLEKYTSPGSSALDVGTGTGILAIAAIKFGAQSAVGIDNDEWAIENAHENVIANGLGDRIRILSVPLTEIHSTFDLISANLMFNTIVEMLPEFSVKLRNGGMLLLAGLLAADKQDILQHLRRAGFEIAEECFEGEWIALAVKKTA